MKLAIDLRKVGHATLLLLFCVVLFNTLLAPGVKTEPTKKIAKGYFISTSNHLIGLLTDDDHRDPVDNEEDEDEYDDEDGAESLISKSFQEFTVSISYHFHQDRLFCDPHGELVSPPPKF
jgi:hypothetical protein